MSEEDKSKLVAFRLSAEEYKEAERIAQMASGHGTIKNDSVNTLAKACLFVRINEWRQIEYQGINLDMLASSIRLNNCIQKLGANHE